MLSTKLLISSIADVRDEWIFETYAKLGEKLAGQDVKIKSLFNPKDKIPSMVIYFKEGRYKFNDFSTGTGGSSIDLVMKLNSITYGEACRKIMEDYNEYTLGNGAYLLGQFKVHSRYKITDWCKRDWNTQDKEYWLQYHIGSSMLETYKVYPLNFYKMEKEEDNEKKELNISG